MPNRVIRDGILVSERVNSLSIEAELFYRRLMSVVDDFGRYSANPTLLRSSVFPLKPDLYGESRISEFIRECESANLIVVYEVAGRRYRTARFSPADARDAIQVPATCQPYTRHPSGG